MQGNLYINIFTTFILIMHQRSHIVLLRNLVFGTGLTKVTLPEYKLTHFTLILEYLNNIDQQYMT